MAEKKSIKVHDECIYGTEEELALMMKEPWFNDNFLDEDVIEMTSLSVVDFKRKYNTSDSYKYFLEKFKKLDTPTKEAFQLPLKKPSYLEYQLWKRHRDYETLSIKDAADRMGITLVNLAFLHLTNYLIKNGLSQKHKKDNCITKSAVPHILDEINYLAAIKIFRKNKYEEYAAKSEDQSAFNQKKGRENIYRLLCM